MKRLTGYVNFKAPLEGEEKQYGRPVDFDAEPERHNTITSKTDSDNEDTHLPVIDLDFPVALVPSSTEGHFHLYINKPTDLMKFDAVLEAMVDAGWVEAGYYYAFRRRMYSVVRMPGVKKE